VQPAAGVQHAVLVGFADGDPNLPHFTESQALTTVYFLALLDSFTPVYSASSSIGATCLLPAQHLMLALQQYLSTVPVLQANQQHTQAANCSGLPSAPLTAHQLELSRRSVELARLCSHAVSAALNQDPSNSPRAGGAAALSSNPTACVAHAAVLGRHHIECASLYHANLQLALLIRTELQKQQASSSPARPSKGPLLSDLAAQVPAPLQRLLQQLGCSTVAALWQALHLLLDEATLGQLANSSHAGLPLRLIPSDHGAATCGEQEDELNRLAYNCLGLCRYSKAILLDSTQADLQQFLLPELQQQLQLHMLLPNVLLQWVADKSSTDSNYTECCQYALSAALASAELYAKVLQDGPA
jgi:hypothetical protein